MKRIIYLAVLACAPCFSQVRYQIKDIRNFWEAYDNLSTSTDSVSVLQRLYFDRASLEFKEFIRIKNITPRDFVIAIKRFPSNWESMRASSESLVYQASRIDSAFVKFSSLYPSFKPPMICFAFSCFRGGTVSKNLALIGVEAALRSGHQGDFMNIVAHEVVHTQQRRGLSYVLSKYLGPQLLVRSIREGGADFIGSMISNGNFNQFQYEYGLEHEAELWRSFEPQMRHGDLKDWLYNRGSEKRPGDLGYFIGFKICESYFGKSRDKAKAVRDIIKVRNYKKFLRRSGYAKKFETPIHASLRFRKDHSCYQSAFLKYTFPYFDSRL